MSSEKVTMRSPDGELRDVDPTPEVLTPLMAAGWQQHFREIKPAEPARTTFVSGIPATGNLAGPAPIVEETK
jgi:hypothetical protein